ncbi:efflux RND transporter periplasmic adaptor subunit [Chelatococcus reniformis]|uniref:RND transporter MFP subunit n=1 Tax=Chelatococcus reniformis TaxID=1494448 RepID=A0A916XLH3_9HYPH|nr:efflux RND transporter periplasmic adaptor subunit [Chelatococcus reniformis]GGC80136.1 RND transporter MFP subunit [Chelatococcus reniformis]
MSSDEVKPDEARAPGGNMPQTDGLDVRDPDVREPRPRRLLLIGVAVVAGAAVVAVSGIRGRAKTEQELASWTREQAVPSVELVTPQRGSGAQELVLPGNIEAFSSAPIYARASGYVRGFNKDIGDRVRKGDVLATIDTPELDQQYAQAKADVATSEANFVLAEATARRYHALVGRQIVSQQTDDEKMGDARAKKATLDSARANLARIEALVAFKSLVAPFDGVVTVRSLDIGALVNAGGTTGTALFQVADIHKVRVYVRVPQAYVAGLVPGTKATLDLIQYPGRHFEATLVRTANAITLESRTALVQLEADNPNGKLWPGTYAEVHFHISPNPDALRVPATALIFGEHGIRVATVDDADAIVLKPVKIGQDIGSDVEILTGISPGERIVNGPLETMATGDKVRVATKTAPQPVADAGKKS